MSKPEQVLIIEPQHELKFRGPFKSMITSYLKLKNPTDMSVCFKIKTTAPKRYCVRPNSGVIEPKGVMDIAVCLQPFEYDPNEKNKHKFMVQTMIAPEGDFNPESLWKEASADVLMDTKLKCVFEMPVEKQTETAPLEESAKRIGDASPIVDTETLKTAKEMKILREEETILRQENNKLKEEVIYLQRQLNSMSTQQSSALASSIPPPITQTPMIVIAIIMALLGIVLGKFLL